MITRRTETRLLQGVIDLTLLSAAFWAAFLLRFDGQIPYLYLKRALFLWPYVLVLQAVGFVALDVHRFAWRYVGLREVNRIFLSLGLPACILLVMRLLGARLSPWWGGLLYIQLPLGVILIDFFLAFLAIVAARAFYRIIGERRESQKRLSESATTKTLLIGAGSAGRMVAREIELRPDLAIEVVAFIDDDPARVHTEVHGIPVVGTTHQLRQIARRTGARQAVVTMANVPGSQIRRISAQCDGAGLLVKVVPGLYELISGRPILHQMRKVRVEDLFQGSMSPVDTRQIGDTIGGKRVLVTGAGGLIGAELCRQLADLGPELLVLLDRAEPSLFAIHHGLETAFPSTTTVPVLADVRDPIRIGAILRTYRPQIVFHAATHRLEALVEDSPWEAIDNNIIGVETAVRSALDLGIDTFVHIGPPPGSGANTAVQAARRITESLIDDWTRDSPVRFFSIRIGRLLCDADPLVASVKEQIARGKPVTLSHPEEACTMMTVPQATQLMLEALTMAGPHELILLETEQAVLATALVRDLIALTGLKPDVDVPIEYRFPTAEQAPGDQSYRQSMRAGPTPYPHVFRLEHPVPEREQASEVLRRLKASLKSASAIEVRAELAACEAILSSQGQPFGATRLNPAHTAEPGHS